MVKTGSNEYCAICREGKRQSLKWQKTNTSTYFFWEVGGWRMRTGQMGGFSWHAFLYFLRFEPWNYQICNENNTCPAYSLRMVMALWAVKCLEKLITLTCWGGFVVGLMSWIPIKTFLFWNQPTPVFLPAEFHGQRGLVGYSPWGCKESDTTEAT